MPNIKVAGVKTYRSKGIFYHYHRATGVRIDVDLATTPERFLARVRELDELSTSEAPNPPPSAQAPEEVTAKREGTLGDLFDAWKQSEEWKALKPQTRVTYERVVHPETGCLRAERGKPVADFGTPTVVALRDAIAREWKRWMANYSVKVLRVAFGWGKLRGLCAGNPAQGVPMLPRPGNAREPNRAWSAEEFEVVHRHAPARLRRALLLAYYAGLRVSDVVAVTWAAWDGQVLTVRQSKTGQIVAIRAPAPLREELKRARREGMQIVVNREGRPYTRDGIQTNLWRLTKKLEAMRLVGPGLCFHGLRHSLGAALYDLGLDRDARKAALGHRSDAASVVYERSGDRRAASDRAFAALDAHLAARSAHKNAK